MPAISYLLGYLLLEVKDGDLHDVDGGCVEDGQDDGDGFSLFEVITSLVS